MGNIPRKKEKGVWKTRTENPKDHRICLAAIPATDIQFKLFLSSITIVNAEIRFSKEIQRTSEASLTLSSISLDYYFANYCLGMLNLVNYCLGRLNSSLVL